MVYNGILLNLQQVLKPHKYQSNDNHYTSTNWFNLKKGFALLRTRKKYLLLSKNCKLFSFTKMSSISFEKSSWIYTDSLCFRRNNAFYGFQDTFLKQLSKVYLLDRSSWFLQIFSAIFTKQIFGVVFKIYLSALKCEALAFKMNFATHQAMRLSCMAQYIR